MNNLENNVNVSIVTICFNAAAEIVLTLESVLAQNYKNFEYIIKDGASQDDTVSIINSYIPKFQEKGIAVKFLTESDKGIYDAMNTGVTMCSGTWINFMNAGDCFYSASVLSEIFENKDYSDSSILYGDCAEFEYNRFYLFQKNYEGITSVMPFSHQATFAKRELLLEKPFNLNFRYSADYDFLLNAYDSKLKFTDVNCVVCITNKDGVSSVNYHDMLKESAAILKSHNIETLSPKEAAKKEKILTIKQFVLDHFPVFIKKFIRGIQIKKRHQDFNYIVPSWHPAYSHRTNE